MYEYSSSDQSLQSNWSNHHQSCLRPAQSTDHLHDFECCIDEGWTRRFFGEEFQCRTISKRIILRGQAEYADGYEDKSKCFVMLRVQNYLASESAQLSKDAIWHLHKISNHLTFATKCLLFHWPCSFSCRGTATSTRARCMTGLAANFEDERHSRMKRPSQVAVPLCEMVICITPQRKLPLQTYSTTLAWRFSVESQSSLKDSMLNIVEDRTAIWCALDTWHVDRMNSKSLQFWFVSDLCIFLTSLKVRWMYQLESLANSLWIDSHSDDYTPAVFMRAWFCDREETAQTVQVREVVNPWDARSSEKIMSISTSVMTGGPVHFEGHQTGVK